ncbi:MAG TPA: RICIN domain-containing protein, partial [Pyrinomonadaceae bacterium]|nr:RICIN domain-containing protein [Pyrinomonadaceae bacterium]
RDGTPPFDGAPRPINRFYTNSFSGTSSASAIVAGAVASLQGARRASGRPALTPIELTALLRATGSPQLGGPAAVVARPIGVQPNLQAAINAATASAGGFAGPGFYVIRSKSSGKVLDVDVSWFRGQNDGQRLIQWDYHGGLNQQFEIADAGGGKHWLLPRHTGGRTVLDVSGMSPMNGATIHQWGLNHMDNQRFIIQPVGGYYRIIAAHSGKALDVPAFSRDNGVGIQQYQINGGDNQLFEFMPIR